jgi:hypothetical protein
VAGKIDAFLKLSIVAGVLLASSSVAYYYVIYLPDRDARIDANNGAAEQRRAEEKAAAEQRRTSKWTLRCAMTAAFAKHKKPTMQLGLRIAG